MNKIYLLTENGVSMFYNPEAKRYEALVNGAFYDCFSYRPVNGEGRQLKEGNREAIANLYDKAVVAYDIYVEARERRFEEERMKAATEAVKGNKKSFAEVLEERFLTTLAETSTEDILAKVMPVVENALIAKYGKLPEVTRIQVGDLPEYKTKDVLHKSFFSILKRLMLGESAYLYGEAGTGKSFIARQIAEALNVPFYMSASVSDEVMIKGFTDARGVFHDTPFYHAFKDGGVFLLDELDASIADVLNMLNEALANGVFVFGNGETVSRNENFYCIATGNTLGTGADDVYTGRAHLDGATMDRFFYVPVTYDKDISLQMARGDESIVAFSYAYRKAAKKAGINTLCTYRALKRMATFTEFMSKAETLETSVLKGMSADDIRIIANNIDLENDWKTALYECAEAREKDGAI